MNRRTRLQKEPISNVSDVSDVTLRRLFGKKLWRDSPRNESMDTFKILNSFRALIRGRKKNLVNMRVAVVNLDLRVDLGARETRRGSGR